MNRDLESLIKLVYKEWKNRSFEQSGAHPDEEDLASLVEGKLPDNEADEIKQHITHCQVCSEVLSLLLSPPLEEYEPGFAAVNGIRERLGIKIVPGLEIFLKMKEKAFELVKASGDILIGQEFIPAAVLRSRNIGELKDEVVIIKDFDSLRLKIRVENKTKKYFNVNIEATDKLSKSAIKDLRISLLKGEVELESYLNDSGSVTFEHVMLGSYRIEVSGLEDRIASILIEVKA